VSYSLLDLVLVGLFLLDRILLLILLIPSPTCEAKWRGGEGRGGEVEGKRERRVRCKGAKSGESQGHEVSSA
jgi:hypothetical protein